jgi:hypothetical protein
LAKNARRTFIQLAKGVAAEARAQTGAAEQSPFTVFDLLPST